MNGESSLLRGNLTGWILTRPVTVLLIGLDTLIYIETSKVIFKKSQKKSESLQSILKYFTFKFLNISKVTVHFEVQFASDNEQT